MKTNLKTFPYKHIFAVAMAAFILCFWAFYNGYPLYFNSDTAMYLEAAFKRGVQPDRPILYGLFMFYTSFQVTLWAVVVVQAFIVSLVIFYYFKYFTPSRNFLPYYFGFVVVITFFMGGSFDVSWLMADVFTPVSILCSGLLLFVKQMKTRDFVIISLLVVLSIAMHNSHFFICLGLFFLLLAGFVFKVIKEKYTMAGIQFKRVVYIMGLVLLSNLFLSSIHYEYSGSFKSSRGGTIFLMGNLVDMGVIDTYLAENCGQRKYTLCQYRDTLPSNYVWASNSPLYKTGGWEASEKEYSTIIKDILTTPKYSKTVIYKSILLTLKQYFFFDTGEVGKPTEKVDQAMHLFYPNEYNSFYESREYNEKLNFDFVNAAQTLIVAACFFVFLLVFYFNKLTIKYRFLILFILTALLMNAWVCGTFSGVYFRYQARLIWLVPLPLFLYVMEYMEASNFFPNVKTLLRMMYAKGAVFK